MATVRLLCAVRGLWGVLLLVRPRQVTGTLAPQFPGDRTWLARVLGARVAAESAALLATSDRRVRLAATGVDVLHAASMLPCLFSRRYRRAGLISGGDAAASAVVLGLSARG
jgi:hypothetical protein